MNLCNICGYPIMPPNVPYGYSGPVCQGNHTVAAPAGPMPQVGQVHFWPTPLTVDDVRRIVREELQRAHVVTPSQDPL